MGGGGGRGLEMWLAGGPAGGYWGLEMRLGDGEGGSYWGLEMRLAGGRAGGQLLGMRLGDGEGGGYWGLGMRLAGGRAGGYWGLGMRLGAGAGVWECLWGIVRAGILGGAPSSDSLPSLRLPHARSSSLTPPRPTPWPPSVGGDQPVAQS